MLRASGRCLVSLLKPCMQNKLTCSRSKPISMMLLMAASRVPPDTRFEAAVEYASPVLAGAVQIRGNTTNTLARANTLDKQTTLLRTTLPGFLFCCASAKD